MTIPDFFSFCSNCPPNALKSCVPTYNCNIRCSLSISCDVIAYDGSIMAALDGRNLDLVVEDERIANDGRWTKCVRVYRSFGFHSVGPL